MKRPYCPTHRGLPCECVVVPPKAEPMSDAARSRLLELSLSSRGVRVDGRWIELGLVGRRGNRLWVCSYCGIRRARPAGRCDPTPRSPERVQAEGLVERRLRCGGTQWVTLEASIIAQQGEEKL